ncbi:MAG: 2TM domain-containing protein [Pseudanabaenaceae cyanobacterium SKYGB_i_bin29]|nr:2TM domain-containing protein [Pseudanabaenaceae cyanobacterium SKYG29]MDW8420841.1 2TM domain-containing protein [Pseudanabaenaceae cyanobacterium SKYGB_i_bin29]
MNSYTELEVQQILQKALLRSQKTGEKLSRAQVEEIARELGVSPEDFALAEKEWQEEKQLQSDLMEFIQVARRRFRDGLVTYVVVNAVFLSLNFFTARAITWAIYPLLIWGVFVALEGWSVFVTDGSMFERKFQEWYKRKQQERMTQELKQKLVTTATVMTDKVGKTVVSLTDRLTQKLSQKVEQWLDDKQKQ